VSFASALRAAQLRANDPDALSEVARAALAEGEEEQALPVISTVVENVSNPRLWQWKGLLERAMDEHERALASFAAAARLDPNDASIAHGFARVALEAGIPSEQLFEQAIRLAPNDGAVRLGLAAARLAAGRGEQAEAELDAALLQSPLWIEGHNQIAQLRSMLGRSEGVALSLERALQTLPDNLRLWQALFDLRVKGEKFAALNEDVAIARRKHIDASMLRLYEAIAASELEQTTRADKLFAEIDAADQRLPIWRIRHLLRTGRAADALPLIDLELAGEGSAHVWPYAAIAWRTLRDPRAEWLECGGKLVSIVDLSDRLPPLERIADVLRSIHVAKGEYVDQSVRGGTQTDGPLLSRIEPEIRALRAAIVEAVEGYRAQLPPNDPKHPLLSRPRDRRVRFSGSWSVRLRGAGFHTSHVHPQGWISSALYVALPSAGSNTAEHAGWLQIGEPPIELNSALGPTRLIEPKSGQLVLFPSWMWHGTVPFSEGERLTVAFDVSVPR